MEHVKALIRSGNPTSAKLLQATQTPVFTICTELNYLSLTCFAQLTRNLSCLMHRLPIR